MKTNATVKNFIIWALALLFIVIGVLNVWLVHPVPGMFYLVLSVFYVPATNLLLRKKFGFAIPFAAQIIVALVILWGTLAVSDLADLLGV